MVFFERILHIKAVQEHGSCCESDLRQSQLDPQLHDEVAALAALLALSFWREPIEDGGCTEELFLREDPLAVRVWHFCVEGVGSGGVEGGGGRGAIWRSSNGHTSVKQQG